MSRILILSILAATLAFAQPPAGKGPRGGQDRAHSFNSIKTYLGLSDTQVASMTEARRSSAQANRGVTKDLRAKHEALQQTLNNGNKDAAAIGQATLEIQNLRKQLEANMAKSREQAVSFLSADQKTKLATLEQSRDLRRELREAHALQLIAPSHNQGRHSRGPRGMHPGGADKVPQ